MKKLGIIALILCFALFIKSVLFPFLISIVIAYILKKSVLKLCILGLPRCLSSIISVLFFFFILFSIMVFIIPFWEQELSTLLVLLPEYSRMLINKLSMLLDKYLIKNEFKTIEFGVSYMNQLPTMGIKAFLNSFSGIYSIFSGIISLIFLVPFLSFFMVKDWHKFFDFIYRAIPRSKVDPTKKLLSQISSSLDLYITGQAKICAILAIYYSVAFLFISPLFALKIGLTMLIFLFVPYMGFAIGFLISASVSFFQYGQPLWKVIVIFVIGTIIESAVLLPKILGTKIGIHPVFAIFSIILADFLFGILGVFIAIPSYIIVQVCIKYSIDLQNKREEIKN